MTLLKKLRDNHKNFDVLNKVSLDAIRVTIEACNCSKDKLCNICKNLLEYYKWKSQERKKYLDNACEWLMHEICIVFYGLKYKEENLHFNRDIYTLKEIVELHDEYLIERKKENES